MAPGKRGYLNGTTDQNDACRPVPVRLCLLKTPSTGQALTFPCSGSSSPHLMIHSVYALLATARSSVRSQRELALENHRKRFKLYWTWKSRHRRGRPRIEAEIRTLIRRMARENPTWGQDLWRGLRSSRACDGNRAGADRTPISVAESLLRARGRDPSTGMLGPRHRPRRAARASPSMKARSSPSRWSAGCIIATNDRLGRACARPTPPGLGATTTSTAARRTERRYRSTG